MDRRAWWATVHEVAKTQTTRTTHTKTAQRASARGRSEVLYKDPNVVFTSSDGHTELSDITTYLPRGSAVKPTRQETQVWSLAGEDHPGEGKSNPLQYSCLEKPMDRGAWRATGLGISEKSRTTRWLNNNTYLLLLKSPKSTTLTPPNAGGDTEPEKLSFIAGGSAKWYSHFGR